MKSFVIAAAIFASSSFAWLPSCGWNDCLGSWNGGSCDKTNGWECLCSNSTAIAQLNTCVATSCTNATDQKAIYGAVAQLCANNGAKVTNSQEATFSATSGGSLAQITAGPSGYGPAGGWGSSQWASFVSACSTGLPGAPNGWGSGQGPWSGHSGWGGPGGPGGSGGFGPGGFGGPWGTKASGINCARWTTWTEGWGPFSSWTGTWSGCSSTTASPVPATITTTIVTGGSTQVLTGTTFGIQAVAQTSSGSGSGSGNAASASVQLPHGLQIFGAVAAGVFFAMLAL